ncbi:hypothetical protein [uncultured Victivallis sp.]|uniref:hypothetical protein n=1 Tax=uncultured Victivallis sp. TaxID=354118 RepID=UPI0025E2DA90|nr:hypothetical protein [uncultured Victivallis sp.]
MENLYAADQKKDLEELFRAPGALYRDTPFWAWNCKLDREQIRRQIAAFREMGMGGFHMHARTGLATAYLGPEFMSMVRECVDVAKRDSMLAWLYDEDRWPSGAAGGIVTREPKFRARYLLFTPNRRTEAPDAANDNSGKLLGCYAVRFDADGCLAESRMIGEEEAPGEGFEKFYLYRMVRGKESWFNDETYVDTLNPAAIRRFVEVTHEAYAKCAGEEFGRTVPAIFTDEPQFSFKSVLKFAGERKDVILPYTDDLPESYRAAYGAEFLPTLPELVWELPGGAWSLARYRYHDHVAERFAAAFADTIGEWCEAHNLRLTGHMMSEPTLESQTSALGEAMRSYRSFQLPGIDMLCDDMEFTTAKQAQSASHQYGCGGVLSELYGVTDWDCDFTVYKGQGDWQAALGVTVRVPHLAWMSMAGEAKRDYPASIAWQSPWWKRYRLISDHFARVDAALTRGAPQVRVGVIHPVESYWMVYGPQDQTARRRSQISEGFENTVSWLLDGLVDFDLIAESLLPSQSPVQLGKHFIVGRMAYDLIVVPPGITMRSTTIDRLESFVAAGGKVIFAGDVAVCCDAVLSDRPAKLAEKCCRIDFSRTALLDAVEECRDVKVVRQDGYPAEKLLYQMRRDGEKRILFLVNTERAGEIRPLRVMIRGAWQLRLFDTHSGAVTPVEARQENGWTIVENDFPPHGHLLLELLPSSESVGRPLPRIVAGEAEVEAATVGFLRGTMPVTLDEPNVLVLDLPEWRLAGEAAWRPREEILRADDQIRDLLGLRRRGGQIVQPWAQAASGEPVGRVELRFTVEATCDLAAPELAFEPPAEPFEIEWDGQPVTFHDSGFWTDECVRKTPFPAIAAGKHELIFRCDYSARSGLERFYLLGDFGVEVRGDETRLIAPVRELHWGDIAAQGLPFYGGNVTYHATVDLPAGGPCRLRIPGRYHMPEALHGNLVVREVPYAGFHGTLIEVAVDGREAGAIAFAPFECPLGELAAGRHAVDLTLYGHRANSFGVIHLAFRIPWIGPQAWRTRGDQFCYEYRLRPLGITTAPRILREC